jgi:hypothetical protein
VSEGVLMRGAIIQDDSKLLSGFSWLTNGNPDDNLESLCIIATSLKVKLSLCLTN